MLILVPAQSSYSQDYHDILSAKTKTSFEAQVCMISVSIQNKIAFFIQSYALL